MANYETILVDRKDDVVTITFNRPNKRNAMNPKLHNEMVELLTELRYDQHLRVLVLTGAGESFSAGEDLKEFFYDQQDRMQFERRRSCFRSLRSQFRPFSRRTRQQTDLADPARARRHLLYTHRRHLYRQTGRGDWLRHVFRSKSKSARRSGQAGQETMPERRSGAARLQRLLPRQSVDSRLRNGALLQRDQERSAFILARRRLERQRHQAIFGRTIPARPWRFQQG